MRGYVERMDLLAYSMPEGEEPSADDVAESFRDEADKIRENEKYGKE